MTKTANQLFPFPFLVLILVVLFSPPPITASRNGTTTPPTTPGFNRTCTNSFECYGNLVCLYHNETNSTYCDYCTMTEQCTSAYGEVYYCLPEGEHLFCRHKPLWPLQPKEIIAAVLLFLGGAIAAGGGIGGGGVFIPILILLAGFQTKDAVPISSLAIAGASIANNLQMGPKRHPLANRPLIDYDLSLLMQPLALCGTLVGVILNTIFPEWLILILMIITLITTTYRTAKKGVYLYIQEKMQKSSDQSDYLLATTDKSSKGNQLDIEAEATDENISPELKILLEKESRTPWVKILALTGILTLVSVYSILTGGKGESMVGLEICSITYWGVYVIIFPILFLITRVIVWYLINLQNKRFKLHYQFYQGDIRWTPINTLVTSLLSLGAGILSSLLGIGGGMVLSPVMLELKVLPSVTAATASYMILFTSVSSCVQFGILDRILWDYGGAFIMIGFLSAFVGQSFLNWLVRKYNKKSCIILFIVIIIGLSILLLGISSGIHVADQLQHDAYMGFNSYCSQ